MPNVPRGSYYHTDQQLDQDAEKSLHTIAGMQEGQVLSAESKLHVVGNINQILHDTARSIHDCLGISRNAAGQLERMYGDNPETVAEAMTREKVEKDLYNHLYQELTDEYCNTHVGGKLLIFGNSIGRAAATFLGFNNRIEAEMHNRFGPEPVGMAAAYVETQPSVQERRDFVAERIHDEVLVTLPPVQMAAVAGVIPPALIPAGAITPLVLQAALAQADPSVLYAIRDLPMPVPPGNELAQSAAFQDLLVLTQSATRRLSETVSMAVNDETRLHRMVSEWRMSPNAAARDLAQRLETNLIRDSIWPYAKNPEAKALLNVIEEEVETHGFAAALALWDDIMAHDVPASPEDQDENVNLRNTINQAYERMGVLREELRNHYRTAGRMISDLTAITAAIRGTPVANRRYADLVNRRAELQQQQRDEVGEINGREREYLATFATLNGALAGIPTAPAFPPNLAALAAFAAGATVSTYAELTTDPTTLVPPRATLSGFHNHIEISNAEYAGSRQEIDQAYLPLARSRVRQLPFQVLMRLERRRYCRERNLDPRDMSEESMRVAMLRSETRVQQAGQNVDLERSANRLIGEEQAMSVRSKKFKQLLGRKGTWQDITSSFGKFQRGIGLEGVQVQTMSANDAMAQLIASDPRYAFFTKLHKLSTTADIRQMIADSKVPVSVETLEEFSQKLIYLLEGKIVNIKTDDWDISEIVKPLQEIKNEIWVRQYVETIKQQEGENIAPERFVQFLADQREARARQNAAIREMVRRPGAMWQKFLVKRDLTQLLTEGGRKQYLELQQSEIGQEEARIATLEQELQGHDPNSAEAQALNAQIEEARRKIALQRKDLDQANTLNERVQQAFADAREQKLGYFASKKLFKARGLEQVYAKMGMNFRLKRYWENTKWAASKMWEGTKEGASSVWSWSRENVLNMERAGQAGSVLRLAASPVTVPLWYTWKIGTYPFKLMGQAAFGATKMPGSAYRWMNAKAMARWLIWEPQRIAEDIATVQAEQKKLADRMQKAPFSWDKKRLDRKIKAKQREVDQLYWEYEKLCFVAKEWNLPPGPLDIVDGASLEKLNQRSQQMIKAWSTYPANDNAQPEQKQAA